MENLNAEEVKQMLEAHKKRRCVVCPLGKEEIAQSNRSCGTMIAEQCLALITSLEQRIEELTEEVESLKQAKEHEHASFMETFGEYGEKCERLTEENESLSTALANYDRQTDVRIAEEYVPVDAYDELREENERLKELGTTKEIEKEIVRRETRADTVRKMQERIAEHATNGYPRKVRLDVIDQIAKEMVEGANEN